MFLKRIFFLIKSYLECVSSMLSETKWLHSHPNNTAVAHMLCEIRRKAALHFVQIILHVLTERNTEPAEVLFVSVKLRFVSEGT